MIEYCLEYQYCFPCGKSANIQVFKAAMETLEEVVKYVESLH